MAKALEEAGFDVTVATDVDQASMAEAVNAFGAKLKANGGVGLFYFSGHGAQIGGENYLIPVSVNDAAQVETGSVTATQIVNVVAGAHNGLNIFILDACRTNPFDPNGAHGLSRIDSNASLFVSYATSPGAVALDGAGHNSPYTKYLSEWIATPDLSIEDTFKRTLKGVYQDTHGEQTPWISSTFFGDFVFHPEERRPRRRTIKLARGRPSRPKPRRSPECIARAAPTRAAAITPASSRSRRTVTTSS
jgi:uncharacterized caspase-like protein